MTLTAMALSGGVDSLVAAHLLKEAGERLLGIHFVTGFETDPPLNPDAAMDDLRAAARRRLNPIARRLQIPLEIVDCRTAFRKAVIDDFKHAYLAGRTPNPCMVCNPRIKFGYLLEMVRELGASRLATGHYARIGEDDQERVHLLRGVDSAKDQSYFLARLSPRQLALARFPLGDLEKSAVKQLASKHHLHPVTKAESQDICFIRNRTYSEFLKDDLGLIPQPGPIVDIDGREIGRHPGLHRFTIGQRRGINCPAPDPYYVVRIEPESNRLVVGAKHDLDCPECNLEDMNWIQPPPKEPFQAHIRIRYRHRAEPAQIHPLADHRVRVAFQTPQAAVTPGQGGVIYQGDEVLGGGWIARNIVAAS